MANEVFTMVLLYHFMCFTPFISEPSTKLAVGTSFCILESLNLIINLGYICFGQVKDGIRAYKLWVAKKKRLQKVKEESHKNLKDSAKQYAFKRK